MAGRLLLSLLLVLGGTRLSGEAPLAGFFDLPVPGGAATLDVLALRPAERGIALHLLARQFGEVGIRPWTTAILSGQARAGPSPPTGGRDFAIEPAVIAAPISADAWREALGLRATDDLFTRILTDRGARLVAAGALASTPGIRALLEADRTLLRALCTTSPGAFVIAAPSLALRDGRVDVPGGPASEPIWTALVGESPDGPAAFILALTSRDHGRLAWFYDMLSSLEAARLRSLLPPGTTDKRLARARALYEVFLAVDRSWRPEERPFWRSPADPSIVITATALDGDRVARPRWRWLWAAVFGREDLTPDEVAGVRQDHGIVDLAWLTHAIGRGGPRDARRRFEMLRFAQRVFGRAHDDDATDVLTTLGGFRRYRALVLALERMGITAPGTYRAAIDAARRVDDQDAAQRGPALITFQGALSIVEGARHARALDEAAARRLVLALSARVTREPGLPRAIAAWVTEALLPELPRLVRPDAWTGRTAYESVILQALAGRPREDRTDTIEWEGLEYRIDVHAAELDRLHRIRERLSSPGLDAAIASGRLDWLAAALLTLAYVPALGDPDGPALFGPDLPERHDFDLTSPSSARRQRVPWMPPRGLLGVGRPWRVQGALLGLDLGLATLALRHLDDGRVPRTPTINWNDRLTLARTTASMHAADFHDTDRDEIVAAIARGRQRVAAAGGDAVALRAIAVEAGMSPAARESLPWLASRLPGTVPALFSLRDLLWLGRPSVEPARLARWGVFARPLDGRWTLAMPPPTPWERFTGRPDSGRLGTQLPDLTLRIAEGTVELGLPARLVPALLTYAVEDFSHDVEVRFVGDWPAMAARAAALPVSRIEDYVAALAGTGPLR